MDKCATTPPMQGFRNGHCGGKEYRVPTGSLHEITFREEHVGFEKSSNLAGEYPAYAQSESVESIPPIRARFRQS